jgi:Bacteriophage T4-like capsid assembly protein (Gp20).
MSISKYYKIIKPNVQGTGVEDNMHVGGQSGYSNNSWYHTVVFGSGQRLTRYNEYDSMDADVDVSRALDVIAEEIVGNNSKENDPLLIKFDKTVNNSVNSTTAVTVRAALNTWCHIQDWSTRLFTVARTTVKYGDCIFVRPTSIGKPLRFVPTKNIIGAIIDVNDVSNVLGFEIRNQMMNAGTASGVMPAYFNLANTLKDNDPSLSNSSSQPGAVKVKLDDCVWFTLYNDMTEEAPFGTSVLKSVFKTFKQKELLEDAIIIYRIQRAPERRVFYVDVGKTPQHLIPQHLEQLRNEIKQKKIPTMQGGKSQMDSVYNPQSMQEDFFIPTNGSNSGNRIETLPGGQNLGQLEDLDYFDRKMWRGLRVPESYMNNAADGSSSSSDGKVGIAYQQEIKFTLYIERLQRALEKTLDREFKRFLVKSGIKVDFSTFRIVLPTPSSYKVSRDIGIFSELLGNLASATGLDFISPRFALGKYGNWSEEDIMINERMKREDLGLPAQGTIKDLPLIYNREHAEAHGMDGGLGGGGGGGLDSIDGDMFADDAPPDGEGGGDLPPEDGKPQENAS